MMSIESTETDLDWTRLQGRVLEGGYQLESILSADAVGAVFKVRVLGDSSANAIAKLFGMDAANADEQVAIWESTRELKSRHLSTPLAAGHTQVEGATVAYVVLKRPEESLDEVIRQRPLSKEEAGEVLMAVVRGLDELHSHGFVHGCVSPEHIVAIGEAIQLSVECAGRVGFAPRLHLREPRYRAPESAGQYVTPEADVWCLGATLVEVMTQQGCAEDCSEQAAKLPAPFDSIARRCLDADPETRAKLGQVEALFRPAVVEPSEPKRREPAVAAAVPPPVTAMRAERPARAARPAIPNVNLSKQAAARRTADRRQTLSAQMWIYAAAAIMLVSALIWAIEARRRTVRPTAPITSHPAGPAQPKAWESKTIPPEDAKSVSSAPAPNPKPANANAARQQLFVNGPVWRVVLYAYTRSADAESKARWVNEKYPGVNAQSFSPTGGSPYLVVAGGRMTRDEAERLRQRVRALGLPRDSYIQNYRE